VKLLEGKKILVAGVANENSLAWGIARALHAAGAELAFSCVENNVRRLRKLVPQVGTDVIIPCNVQSEEDVARLFKQVGEMWDGGLDALIHSIAYARFDDLEGEFIKTTKDGFLLATDVSAYSLVSMARAARPLLKKNGGSILTLTFGGSRRVVPNYNVMGPAKAALESAALYLAYDLGKDGIRVNVMSPGVVRTASANAIKGLDYALDFLEKNNPIGRNINQDDLGGPAVFLVSDMAKAVTGATLFVDGGAAILAGG
jgi:enoyl-[acyl-carrier protein] reductase I